MLDSRWWLHTMQMSGSSQRSVKEKEICIHVKHLVWDTVNGSLRGRLWTVCDELIMLQPDGYFEQEKASKTETTTTSAPNTSVNTEKGFYKDGNTLYLPVEPAFVLFSAFSLQDNMLVSGKITTDSQTSLWMACPRKCQSEPSPNQDIHFSVHSDWDSWNTFPAAVVRVQSS